MTKAAALLGLTAPDVAPAPSRRLLAEVREALVADEPPALPAADVADLLPVLVALAPEAAARHRALGLSEAVSRDTLADVGRKLRAYGADTDVAWLVGLLRADVVALGRLQVQRVAESGIHHVHIPEQGPLLPDLVDRSLALAREVLGATTFGCQSWLLDPLLPEALGPEANVVRFAARFAVPRVDRPVGSGPTGADRSVARFVFRRPLDEVLDRALVVPRTRLERFVAGWLRTGGHWTEPEGVLAGDGVRAQG